ncbi:3-ketodihydrosphingosine reductase tsc10 [Aspergillus ellipticus CBS 707.79]|uniref:3-dehydrosphinganine reductase n=1 Tax=Aspergillus ellipticus CBS 707.79 TaxID=1448320 RepID=A0A319EWH1_9EURO|nr:3-ketodihydrosphingosine reductase tsc10 [Aspergillus ellipticus CBS 707.79]
MHPLLPTVFYDSSPTTLGIYTILCGLFLYTASKMFGFSRNRFVVEGRTIVVTGGSEGLGKSVACQLSEKGANIVLVARTTSRLQEALEAVKGSANYVDRQRFHLISADLTDAAECERVMAEATEWNDGQSPDIVWCCAGYCNPGFFAETPVQTLRDQMDTVYWTAANTAHAILKRWLSPISPSQQRPTPTRHLIFTCSTLAFVPIAGYAPYSPAKAAIRSLSDTLSQELEMYNGSRSSKSRHETPAANVKVHTVFPMGILSPGFDNEQKIKPELTKKLEAADKPQAPRDVASIAIKALERGEYMITTMFVGDVMKGAALGPSQRNSFIRDTFLGWFSNLAFIHVSPDLRRQAWYWGVKNGIPSRPIQKSK